MLVKSKKTKAVELAKDLGIAILDNKYLSKETETLSYILTAFKGQEMKEQYTVDGYKIDLYFPIHKLAIECDEFGHKDKSILKRNLDVHLFDITPMLKILIYLVSSILS